MMTRWRASLEMAVRVTYPTCCLQRIKIPPEKPEARMATQSHLGLSLLQKRRMRSELVLVSNKQIKSGFNLCIISKRYSTVREFESPLQFQGKILVSINITKSIRKDKRRETKSLKIFTLFLFSCLSLRALSLQEIQA